MKRVAVLGSSSLTADVVRRFPERLALAEDAVADIFVAGAGAGLHEVVDALRAGHSVVLTTNDLMVYAGHELAPFRSSIRPAEPGVSAIWQSVRGEVSAVKRLVLAASDGSAVLGAQAIAAHHLFEIPYERMEVVNHAQGVVQAMVEFADGSMKAVFVEPDPRRSLQHALSYPERWDSGDTAPVDLVAIGQLTFEPNACLDEAVAAARACYPKGLEPTTRGIT